MLILQQMGNQRDFRLLLTRAFQWARVCSQIGGSLFVRFLQVLMPSWARHGCVTPGLQSQQRSCLLRHPDRASLFMTLSTAALLISQSGIWLTLGSLMSQ